MTRRRAALELELLDSFDRSLGPVVREALCTMAEIEEAAG